MLRLAADENFHNIIIRGLLREKPEIDLLRIQDTEIYQADDSVVLEWCAGENRILLTHDVNTIIGYAYERVNKSIPMPGVFVVSGSFSFDVIIESLLLTVEGSLDSEWEDQVIYLPL